MRTACTFAGLLSSVLLAACSPIEISSDYDPRVDFSRLRTWAWSPESGAAASEAAGLAPLDSLTLQRAKSAVERILLRKGMTQVASGSAELWVKIHIAVERYFEADPSFSWGWGYGWAPYPWSPWWGGTWGPAAVYAYDQTVLVISLIEPKPAPRLVWRGVAAWSESSDWGPVEREERISKAVREALEHYPPPGTPHPDPGTPAGITGTPALVPENNVIR